MSEWNGQEISEMDIDHINNTIALLERRAHDAYDTEELEVENTCDEYRAQAFAEMDWTDFLHGAYDCLCMERDKRPVDLGMNF